MKRQTVAAALLLLAGCHATTDLTPDGTDLRVATAPLDFGTLALFAKATRTIALQNASAAPVQLQVVTHAPFTAPAFVSVPGGATVMLSVGFSPQVAGAATGTVELAWETTTRTIALSGAGVACPVPDVCHDVQVVDGACTVATAADGAACQASCLRDGTCHAGTCVGSALACDDANACTVDFCDAQTGCSHAPVQCPSTKCNVATCDPQNGCGLAPVQDGTSCGDAVCAWADICLDGACQRAPTPNAPLECKYSDVVAGDTWTCALTLGGHVRCWGGLSTYGENPFDQAPSYVVMPPTAMDGFFDEVAIAANDRFCAVSSGGIVHCGWSSESPSAGSLAGASGIALSRLTGSWSDEGWVVSAQGALSTWSDGGALVPVSHAPVKEIVQDWSGLWVLDAQGNLDWTSDWGLPELDNVPIAAPGHVMQVVDWGVDGPTQTFLLYDNGAVDLIASAPPYPSFERVWDAGAVAVGGASSTSWDLWNDENVCFAESGGRVTCTSSEVADRHYQVPGEIVKLTARAELHVCALNDLGDIWCWGDNTFGQLDDQQLDLAPRFLDLRASSISAGMRVSDGGLYLLQQELRDLEIDAGTTTSQVQFLGVVGEGRLVGGSGWVLDHGALFDAWQSLSQPVATGIASCDGVAGLDCGAIGCTTDGGDVIFYGACFPDAGVPTGCALERDGGVVCVGTSVALPTAATVLSSFGSPPAGCAIVANGQVLCWNDPHDIPRSIPGGLSGARQIQGSLNSGCAVVGASTVQCWGDNYYGELGQPGPASTTAVTHRFDEPVVQLTADTFWGWANTLESVCVLLASGRVACWGWNDSGETGPMLLHSEVPLQIVK